MNTTIKEELLAAVNKHITTVQKIAKNKKREVVAVLKKIRLLLENPKNYSTESADKSFIEMDMLKVENGEKRLNELTQLISSPYFSKCVVQFIHEEPTILYFAKFSLPESGIYSWISPAAQIRFRTPGKISYVLPQGERRTGSMSQNDQFLINNGEIMYMSTQRKGAERELVYQAHITDRKNAFILPEIVEKMEEYQDSIIRIPYQGSMLIAGPAGSGKTTLALHRIAFLVQSPETTQLFPPKKIIVFVQDDSTKKYFNKILPELGITDVTITTFEQWALASLRLNTISFVYRFGENEHERDMFEYAKFQTLENLDLNKIKVYADEYKTLSQFYNPYFSTNETQLFKNQKSKLIMDRFDLTILLKIKQQVKSKKPDHRPLRRYSLILIDEAENYLSSQIKILHTQIDSGTQAIMYVGDLVQQTKLFTLRDWSQVDEKFDSKRKIVLPKVYRNTKEILSYIQSIGYSIEIPDQLVQGEKVIEKVFKTVESEIAFLQSELKKIGNEEFVGILVKDPEQKELYEPLQRESVSIFTIYESQGLEFDRVFLAGVDETIYLKETIFSLPENKKVLRDLIYVGLTRAMRRLYVTGTMKLSEIVGQMRIS